MTNHPIWPSASHVAIFETSADSGNPYLLHQPRCQILPITHPHCFVPVLHMRQFSKSTHLSPGPHPHTAPPVPVQATVNT
jgi:hypothetical protein